jgi:non-homologous end joining protein Ku
MRAIWKGSISFSLVNIPISLYPATRREELKFQLLRKSDLSPIHYKRVAEADGKEVAWEQIVKGYQHEKGKFVVLEDEDFRRADTGELIEKMTDKWKPEKYKDDYRQKLLEVIEEKIKLGGRAPAEAPVSKRKSAKVIDLVSVLQQSLQQAGAGAAKAERKSKKALKKAA